VIGLLGLGHLAQRAEGRAQVVVGLLEAREALDGALIAARRLLELPEPAEDQPGLVGREVVGGVLLLLAQESLQVVQQDRIGERLGGFGLRHRLSWILPHENPF